MDVRHVVEKVKRTIHRCALDVVHQDVGVGVSGGRDSLMMLHVLKSLGYKTKAYHCNFQLRGEESERDMHHTLTICEKWGVECTVQRFDTTGYAEQQKISIEMAARELRYGWFDALLASGEIGVFALGHHLKDSVETVVLNLLRGSGIKGLLGIPMINGAYFRPIHSLTEVEIEAYVNAYSIEYVFDSTNAENVYKRNLVRNKIFPLFEEINSCAIGHVYECSERLAEVNDIYREYIDDAIARIVKTCDDEILIPLDLLNVERRRSVLLYEILSSYGFASDVIASVAGHCDAPVSGKIFYSSDYRLLVDRSNFILKSRTANLSTYTLEEESSGVGELNYSVYSTHELPPVSVLRNSKSLYADKSKLKFPLLFRRWAQGDRIHPFGMRGTKLVSDYFTDQHFTLFEKENTWLVVDAEGDVIWIVGHRTSEKIRIDAQTKGIYVIKKEDE